MDTNENNGLRRRGKALVAAALVAATLTVGGALTATAAMAEEPAATAGCWDIVDSMGRVRTVCDYDAV